MIGAWGRLAGASLVVVGLGGACRPGSGEAGAGASARAPAGPPVLVRAGSPRVQGAPPSRGDRRRARARARAAVDAAREALARCALGALGSDDLRLHVDLEVAADGGLRPGEVRTQGALDVRAEGCVREALAAAAPAAPPPAVDVVVTLPLALFVPRAWAAPGGEAPPAPGLDRGIDRGAGAPQ